MGADEREATSRGLTRAEAARQLAQHGANILPAAERPPSWRLLARQFTHRFAVLLWVACGLALLGGMPPLAVAIVMVVLVKGGFAFVQEYRADRAADALRDLMPAIADLVVLEAGDRVSADLRVVAASGLAVDESLLTGESVPRRAGPKESLYAGTFVVEGAAEALVESTGSNTRLAGIATLTRHTRRRRSPLALRLDRVVRVVGLAAGGVGAGFFGLALLLGLPIVDAFLLGLGVTVALVPEGLLPTVTLSLARGARRMAASNALVRNLDSVETLGSVTYICTDKTGTLTRNEMSVARVWTPAGTAHVTGTGYDPRGEVVARAPVAAAVAELAYAGVRASTGRLVWGESGGAGAAPGQVSLRRPPPAYVHSGRFDAVCEGRA